jgi:PhnB protein
MARVNTYLNFMGNTEEAFNYYEKVFNTKITALSRMKDFPNNHGAQLSEEDSNKVMNVQLPILDGHVLMGTDMLESMGHKLQVGNNFSISLDVDTRAEADRIYNLLSVNTPSGSGMGEMPWGAYWGSCEDQFGIRWMISSPL